MCVCIYEKKFYYLVFNKIKMITSSTLVETVSIDYEDFTEGFLTCSTCLCPYDAFERSPKQLTCSHTFCKGCLEKIANQPGVTDSFRCPICRESIPLSRNGVSGFPASFVVNQLLDLVNKQRREFVPKCSTHLTQELLFCEPCDCVFCALCTQGAHQSNNNNSTHQVIPFSIAIKRMSEILLYKAKQCIEKLNDAHDNVSNEIRKLDQNAEQTSEDVNRAFQQIIEVVNRRKEELLCHANKMQEEKRQVLQEQLNEISNERNKVQSQCNNLQYQVDVRNITKKIADLTSKIEMVTAMAEPKENCFIKPDLPESSIDSIRKVVDEFGQIRSSKTFPSLCEASVEKCAANLRSVAKIVTYDYTGALNHYGGDPVSADLTHVQTDHQIQTNIVDKRDGTYDANFVPPLSGLYRLNVCIFGRPIRTYPLEFEAASHINPICVYGSRGSKQHEFVQPVSLAISQRQHIYVLDTGNNRIKVLSQNDCSNSPFNFVQHITLNKLKNGASTGMALKRTATTNSPQKVEDEKQADDHLFVANWRSKLIVELNARTGEIVKEFTHADFVEPTLLAVTSKGEVIVVDNSARSIFIFREDNKLRLRIDANAAIASMTNSSSQNITSTNTTNSSATSVKQSRNSTNHSQSVNNFGTIDSIALDKDDNIIIGSSRIAVLSSENGSLIRTFNCTDTISNPNHRASLHSTTSLLKEGLEKSHSQTAGFSSKGAYSGLACDNRGFLLATRMEKTNCIQIFDYETGQFKYIIDSTDARLRRPTSLCTTEDYHCIVVDLGNDCIKKYRYY